VQQIPQTLRAPHSRQLRDAWGVRLGTATLTRGQARKLRGGWEKSAANRSEDGPPFAGRARTHLSGLCRGFEGYGPLRDYLG
jgi:hypothetical protein